MNTIFRGAAVPANLRETNLRTIFDLFRLEGVLSRAEIARFTGISVPTVSSAVRFLADKGIVSEIGEGQGGLGRKPILLQFNNEAGFTIGVDLGGNSIDVGLVDLAGKIKTHVTHPCSGSVVSTGELSIIPEMIQSLLTGVPWERILGIGVGLPGVVDPATGEVGFAPQLGRKGWQAWDTVRQVLRERFPLDLVVENDVNAAALGEQRARAKDSLSNYVFVSVGGGIGAGLILDGRLYRGSHNASGEVGYMIVDGHSGSRAGGEFGDLERIVSCPALIARARALGWSQASSRGVKIRLNDEIGQLGEDARQGDKCAGRALEEGAEHLALALANIISVYDPALVVLGGVILEAGDWFVRRISDELSRVCPLPVAVEASCNGSLAGLVGAAVVALAHNQHMLLAG